MTPTFLFGLTASLLVIAPIGHFLPGKLRTSSRRRFLPSRRRTPDRVGTGRLASKMASARRLKCQPPQPCCHKKPHLLAINLKGVEP